MWTYQGKAMKAGRSWTDVNGRKYPAQWYGRTTDAEKVAAGWVEVADPAPFDSRFYWSAGNPKNLEDVTETDEGGNEVVTKGLKSVAIAQAKTTAGSLLAPTDWYIVREQETGEVTPTDILNYRQAVRTASGAIETAITGATTLEQFMALYDAPVDAEGNVTGNAPINDWPEV
jgi:hypothetical protein